MILCAYVGDGGDIVRIDDEGTSNFSQVFVRRHKECRYAIVKMKDTYASIDLYESVILPDGRLDMGIHQHYRTLNAALLATIFLYNTGDTLDGKTQEEIDAITQASQDCPDCQWGSKDPQ